MLLKLMIILLFVLISLSLRNWLKLNRKKRFLKSKKLIAFNKKNLNNWMHLTKKERYNLSKQESIFYLDKRKLLLDEIRKEYKEISRVDSQKNIKKK
ncbi:MULTISPECIES: hypothetical protein [Prochlorococcus]|uniref:hypothetical protein n=1 Tax=Prochlorococcus TaxID=1218 RepID=UPI0005174328|nr:hypothetical protein [Prochlorococcus marinus]